MTASAATSSDLLTAATAAILGAPGSTAVGSPLKWLDSEHLMYAANKLTWEKNERRLRGGDYVLTELRRFAWEEEAGASIKEREAEATYINFVAAFADIMVGHLFREAPAPDEGLTFGTLGRVARANANDDPSRAEQVYYNSDGEGNDGSQWNTFWSEEMKWAMATGHRWILVDAPAQQPRHRADELKGLRPYLQSFSPLAVPLWHYDQGRLAYAVVRYKDFAPFFNANGDLVVSNTGLWYLLLVRRGYEGLGPEWAEGGWWKFDPEKAQLDHGTYDATDGEIPLFPLFYQRDKVVSISRPGVTELGQVAVSYMNLSSAADFDAWDSAASIQFLLGATAEVHNLVVAKLKEGSRIVPVPATGEGNIPAIADSNAGAVPAGVFDTRLNRKMVEADRLASMEASVEPGSSGASKRAGFVDTKAPRLALMAGEIESAQNNAIYFFEKFFGAAKPTGAVKWPRQYDLVALSNSITELFNMLGLVQAQSPTLIVRAVVAFLKERQIVTDERDLAVIAQELEGHLATKRANAQAFQDRLDAAAGAQAPSGQGIKPGKPPVALDPNTTGESPEEMPAAQA